MGDIPLEVFTWTERQAHGLAHSQSGASNCGATALLNVLTALDVAVPDIDAAERAVHTNARRHGVAVSEYLAARSVAGCTGENIVSGFTHPAQPTHLFTVTLATVTAMTFRGSS